MKFLRRFFAPATKTRTTPARRARLQVEALESRLMPTVTFHGGAVLPHVEAQAVYLGQDWSTNSTLKQLAYNVVGQGYSLDWFVGDMVHGGYMDMLTNAGYGVGRGSSTTGRIDATPLNKMNFLEDYQIQRMLQADINKPSFFGGLAAPDANRLYVIFVEPGVAVRFNGLNSISNFQGYHSAFLGTKADGTVADIRYAVVCEPGGRGELGALGEFNLSLEGHSINRHYTDFQNLTKVASQEIASAVTDPDNGYRQAGWHDDALGGDIGDVANAMILNKNKYVRNAMIINYHGYTVQPEVNQQDQLIAPTDYTIEYAAAEFRGQGVWRWSSLEGWRQLDTRNATQVGADGHGDVVAAIPGQGVWRYEDGASPQQLTTSDASAVAIAGNGYVVANLVGHGLYRFMNGPNSGPPLTTANATLVAIDAHGDVAADLGGVWRYQDSTGWQRLSIWDASALAIAYDAWNGGGDVVFNLQLPWGLGGVFRYEDGFGLQHLTWWHAQSVSINGFGQVAASFQGPGGGTYVFTDQYYEFNHQIVCQQLTTWVASQVSITDSGDVLAQFAGQGVWLCNYERSAGWHWDQLDALDAAFISLAPWG